MLEMSFSGNPAPTVLRPAGKSVYSSAHLLTAILFIYLNLELFVPSTLEKQSQLWPAQQYPHLHAAASSKRHPATLFPTAPMQRGPHIPSCTFCLSGSLSHCVLTKSPLNASDLWLLLCLGLASFITGEHLPPRRSLSPTLVCLSSVRPELFSGPFLWEGGGLRF